MKKYFLISTLMLLLLTGCKSDLTCTLKSSEEDYDVEQKVIFDIGKQDKVNKAEINYTMIFKDKDIASDYYKMFETVEEDYDVKQNKNKIIMKSSKDYSEYKETKEEIRKQLEDNGYECK